MAISQIRRAVGTFATRQEAEHALSELRDSGFPMERVSVVAKDSTRDTTIAGTEVQQVGNKQERVGNKADEGATAGAATGGTVGGLTGLLVGLGMLAIPGIGPIMLAGAGATALATTLAGAGLGAVAGGLLGGLAGLGIPEERAKVYNDRVSRGEYLVMVEGTEDELHRAHGLLTRRGIQEWGIYDIPKAETTRAVEAPVNHATVNTVDRAASVSAPIDRAASVPTHDDTIRLHEERLLVDKTRQKTGEVSIGKHVETETAKASVPIEKERIVVERVQSEDFGTAVTPGEASFQAVEAVRMEVYEETADFKKEAFVREEINLRKEVDRQLVDVEETIRREQLDVDVQGNPVVDNKGDRRPNDRI